MITLTKLNGKSFQLNPLYIETIESFPDTTITLTNGRKYVTAESAELVKERILEFYQCINLLGFKHMED
ncbi:flagellar FlbD family protein [Lederbergia citrea]|uniref:Flagellar FlbD family protein n=1 Tax=Lederbergia citrea TaxID=2833581 RepID=A0A942Z3L8_9BACI|nr:flagellar FlbD family protein [Lederbergia citrea]MBS4177115.1 flagellar FlbD family protein [Lederbergia citrea]MBS4203778.1 flagellar FlbD family protein [Lederbergia citrea]MBS4221637.1 flagellar FlbD family protein [Lederbergia citrea]